MSWSAFHWRPGKLASNSSSLLAWMLFRAGAQVAMVVLLARQMGAQQYGQFVSVIAVASFLTPFVGLGLSNMVLRNGARDPERISLYLARAAQWWVRSLLPCVAIAFLVVVLLLPDGLPQLPVFAAIAAELSAASLTELRARHQQAQHRINAYGAINAGLPAARLIALGVLFVTIDDVGVAPLFWTYAGCSSVYALILWHSLSFHTAAVEQGLSEPMSVASGLPFSMATLAVRLQTEFNKPALAHLGFDLAGTYNAGQRASDLASMPLSALQESLWPRLYAQHNPMKQLRRTGLSLLILALILSGIIWLSAPLLPWLLGSDFASAATVMRDLAWLPLLQVFRGLQNFYAIHLGRMSLIGWTYGFGALLSIGLVTLLVPRWGLPGAVVSSYLTETAMIIILLIGGLWRKKE